MIFFGKKKNEKVGVLGEKMAVKFLKRRGYKILERNFQNKKGRRLGEIDIIAKAKNNRNEEEIVFVEVKTRVVKNKFENPPEENIRHQKLYKLQKIAEFYIQKNKLWKQSYRFDAVSITLSADFKDAKIKHLKSIFL